MLFQKPLEMQNITELCSSLLFLEVTAHCEVLVCRYLTL